MGLAVIFTAQQVAGIRQGRITAAVVPASERIAAGRVRELRRGFDRHDEDGMVIGHAIELVTDRIDGEQRPVVLTILDVTRTFLEDGLELPLRVEDVSLPFARACGYRRTADLGDAWRLEHPRTPLVQIVRFAVADVRDRPRFLEWTRMFNPGVRGDYSSSPPAYSDGAEALSAMQLDELAADNRARHLGRHARSSEKINSTPPSRRLEAIEAAAGSANVDLRREMRVIEDRISRAERRVKP